jgi:hypothetical protein
MEQYQVLVEFMSIEELEKELHKAFTEKNYKLAKIISDQLFERKLGGTGDEN